jgi:serine/threonine protein kinase
MEKNNFILGSLNNPSVDFWSLGVILFEFLVGVPPFNDETVDKIFENIIEHRVPWDEISNGEEGVSEEARDLMEKLLEPNPLERIGVLDVKELKNHRFFSGKT